MFVTTRDVGRVRHLVLDRPDRMNAVPVDGWDHLRTAFDAFESSELRVLVVRGAGGNFCAGADLGDGPVPLESLEAAAESMRRTNAAALSLRR